MIFKELNRSYANVSTVTFRKVVSANKKKPCANSAKTRVSSDSLDQRVMPPLSSFHSDVRSRTEVILRLGRYTHARRYGRLVEESTTCLAIAPLTSSCKEVGEHCQKMHLSSGSAFSLAIR
jgi:hypothetical protein